MDMNGPDGMDDLGFLAALAVLIVALVIVGGVIVWRFM
jgi:hypothetical protein